MADGPVTTGRHDGSCVAGLNGPRVEYGVSRLKIQFCMTLVSLRPSLHLPRAPCDKFVYDFPYDFWGIVDGYGLRRMCLHYIRLSCDFCTDSGGTDRDKSVRGDCTEIVEFQCSHRAVSASFLWKSYGARAASVRRLYGDTVTAVLMLRNSGSQSVHHLPEYGWLASEV